MDKEQPNKRKLILRSSLAMIVPLIVLFFIAAYVRPEPLNVTLDGIQGTTLHTTTIDHR